MNYDRALLKQEVKEDMRRTRPSPLWATLIFLLVGGVLSGLVQWIQSRVAAGAGQGVAAFMELIQLAQYGLVDDQEMLAMAMELTGSMGSVASISLVFGLLSAVVNWTLGFGYQGYCLDMIRRKGPAYSRLACAIPQWGWVLLTGLLVGLFTFLWGLLMAVGAVAAMFLIALVLGESFLGAVMMFAVWAAVVAGMVAISLRYSMANYILLDERVDALEAIGRSKAMMRGRKWHLFVLELSFIGWYLLKMLVVTVVMTIALVVATGHMTSIEGEVGMGAFFMVMAGWMSAIAIGLVVSALLCLPLDLWLRPYVTGAVAKFYDWSRQADQSSGVWEGRYDDHVPARPQYEDPKAPEPPAQPQPEPQQPQPGPGPEPEPPASAPDRPHYE